MDPANILAAFAVVVATVALWTLVPQWRQRKQDEFRAVRGHLAKNRLNLARQALDCWPLDARLQNHLILSGATWIPRNAVPLLAKPTWVPEKPTELADVIVRLSTTNTGKHDIVSPAGLLPPSNAGGRFPCYTDAIEALDRPKSFWNGDAFRLLGVEAGDGIALDVAATTYFHYLNTCEVLCYEAAYRDRRGKTADGPLRQSCANPFDLGRHNTIGLNVLTIILDPKEKPSFLMHERGAKDVASAMGTFHVVPAGEFQPSSRAISSSVAGSEASLWHTMLREFAEELLGAPDAGGRGGKPIDFSVKPYSDLDAAANAAELRAYFLGVTLDALSLKAEVLAAVVIARDRFTKLCGHGDAMTNEEGLVIEEAAFDESTILQYLATRNTLPAATGCLVLAWHHREALLR
jgi:hypothetical protein